MNNAIRILGLCLLLAGSHAGAQQPFACPQLPPAAGLQWQRQAGDDYLSCKAFTADGRQALGIMLTRRDPKLSLVRSHRAERGSIEDEKFHWYVPDLAGLDPSQLATRRVAAIDFGKGRYAQIWVDAASTEELQAIQGIVQRLDMQAVQLASEK